MADERTTAQPLFDHGSQDFSLDGIRFRVMAGRARAKNDQSSVVLLKPWNFVQQELDALSGVTVRRMLEFGIYQGGSAALWSVLLPLERYVGIDVATSAPKFPRTVAQHPRWSVVRLYGGTSQADREAVERILDTDFNGPLDVVIDDASHQYDFTRRSFEIVFPRLRPGGVYLIEDWSWAHSEGPWNESGHPWAKNPSLANLIFRLVLVAAARPDVIPEIVVRRPFVLIRRGPAAFDRGFEIDQFADNRRGLPELI